MSVAWWVWVLISVVGAGAALARYAVDGAVARRTGSAFPFGTLAVNLSGAALLGVLAGAGLAGNAWILIGTAGVGTYTTFSTLILETERLLEDGDYAWAGLNLFGSMALGLVAITLGWLAGRAL